MEKRLNEKKVPEGYLILGENQYFSRNCYETKLNNNVLVVGTSGAGKTRNIVIPNLLQATGSYVVSDPKGNLVNKMGPYLKAKGYRIIEMDFIHPEKSLKYNPISYCRNTTDIRKLAHMLVNEMHGGNRRSVDPFWDESAEMLLCALIGYIVETNVIEEKDKNLITLAKLIRLANRNEVGKTGRGKSRLDMLMELHEEWMSSKGELSWAVERYADYNTSPDRTQACINVSALAKLSSFDTLETRMLLERNDIDFAEIGLTKTALFVKVSDTDRSMDILVNLFYSQLINELCSFADENCEDNRLPIDVQFLLDDFATNARIDNFQNIISNIRSRGISTMLMLQSESQLRACYGESAQTIVDNCNTYVYMGGGDVEMAMKISKRANKPVEKILNMPLQVSWIFRRGQEPILCSNFNLERFEKEKYENLEDWHKEDVTETEIAC